MSFDLNATLKTVLSIKGAVSFAYVSNPVHKALRFRPVLVKIRVHHDTLFFDYISNI